MKLLQVVEKRTMALKTDLPFATTDPGYQPAMGLYRSR
jgi:hypothetical protein